MEATTHDAARYIFDQASYALSATTQNEWSANSATQPTSTPKHYSEPAPTAATRLTRNRAAALAKRNQSADEQQQQAFQNYSPSRYLNDDPPIPLDGDQNGSYANPAPLPPNVYSYPSSFPSTDDSTAAPVSPSASTSTANGPSHPPPPPHPVGAVHPASLANVYQYPGMMVPGRPGGFPVDDIPPPTMYGPPSLGAGTEMMRVPSASPSVASGSPPPEDFLPANRLPSSRGSSRPKSLENYEYPNSSGPISPLSSSFAPQPLPSTFSSATGGYLHGPPSSQASHPSSNLLPEPSDPDLVLANSDPTANGGRNRNQKTKTKLTDMDRKFICVFAQNHPKARQEDIATKFAVERSTVSKILKCKEKWMKVDFFSSEARVVKHRPSKFPELESALIDHIRMRIASREPVNDSFIKKTALELAQQRGIGKDKFKASSGWVENFKHRHDLRKGGLWDKGGSTSWAVAAAAAKYSQATLGDINGHGVASNGSDEHGGNMDAEEDYDEPHFGRVADFQSGAEESNPLDEASRSAMDGVPVPSTAFHRGMGPNVTTRPTSFPPPSVPGMQYGPGDLNTFTPYMTPSHPKIAGVDSSPQAEAESPTAKQGPNPDFFHVDGTSTSAFGQSPYAFYPTSLQHLTTPRSASVTSRSNSSASGPSIGGSPASVQSAILPSGRHGSPSSVSPPDSGSRRYSGLPPNSVGAHFRGHGHRRSMSGSYTSSPLAVEVGGSDDVRPAGSSLALHNVPHPYITPSRPSRRSVTYSSFSAMMAAGLSLDSSNDGGRVSTRKDGGGARYGHSRSISQGSPGLGSQQEEDGPSFGSPHTIANR